VGEHADDQKGRIGDKNILADGIAAFAEEVFAQLIAEEYDPFAPFHIQVIDPASARLDLNVAHLGIFGDDAGNVGLVDLFTMAQGGVPLGVFRADAADLAHFAAQQLGILLLEADIPVAVEALPGHAGAAGPKNGDAFAHSVHASAQGLLHADAEGQEHYNADCAPDNAEKGHKGAAFVLAQVVKDLFEGFNQMAHIHRPYYGFLRSGRGRYTAKRSV